MTYYRIGKDQFSHYCDRRDHRQNEITFHGTEIINESLIKYNSCRPNGIFQTAFRNLQLLRPTATTVWARHRHPLQPRRRRDCRLFSSITFNSYWTSLIITPKLQQKDKKCVWNDDSQCRDLQQAVKTFYIRTVYSGRLLFDSCWPTRLELSIRKWVYTIICHLTSEKLQYIICF